MTCAEYNSCDKETSTLFFFPFLLWFLPPTHPSLSLSLSLSFLSFSHQHPDAPFFFSFLISPPFSSLNTLLITPHTHIRLANPLLATHSYFFLHPAAGSPLPFLALTTFHPLASFLRPSKFTINSFRPFYPYFLPLVHPLCIHNTSLTLFNFQPWPAIGNKPC